MLPWQAPALDNAAAMAVAAAGGYPADVAPGAIFWVGLRAYSSASIGNKCFQICDSTGGNTQDINIIAGGGVDTAAIATWVGLHGPTAYVGAMYDQSGNGQDWPFDAFPPVLHPNALGSFYAVEYFNLRRLKNTTLPTQAQAFTVSTVINNTVNNGTEEDILSNVTGVVFSTSLSVNPGGAADTIRMYAGGATFIDATATDAAPHAVQAIFNGASSEAYVDGAPTTGTVSTDDFTSPNTTFMGCLYTGGGGQWTNGLHFECGLWAGDFSSTKAAMNANQHAYWGF